MPNIKEGKIPIPETIMFVQKVKKGRDGFILYELHLLGRMVFRYSGKGDLNKCITMRNQWLEEQRT